MTDTFATPDEYGLEGRASDLHSSLGESLFAQAGEAFMGGTRTLHRLFEYGQAAGALPPVEAPYLGELTQSQAPIPEVPIADAKARIKQEGLEQHVKLPDQESIKQPVLDLMVQHGRERADYDAAVSRGPHGFWTGALGFMTEIGAGMIDPVNAAAFSIPVIGEARYGQILARAGEGLAARAAVRGAVGAAQGAVGSAATVPADWWLHTLDGQDYTMADALRSVVVGAGMGGAFHAGAGAIGDIVARSGGAHVPGAALGEGGVTAEEALGIIAPTPAPVHPAKVFADLPTRAREDVVKAAIADVIQDQPVRAAEMLQEAAKIDPRIAESVGITAYHGSPHDFENFDISKIGTGEGAQAYGHGLYFAERPGVAEEYKRKLAGLDAAQVASHQEAIDALRSGREPTARSAKDIAAAREDFKHFENREPTNAEIADYLEKGLQANRGRLYQVAIKADPEHFLDWDKPLSEQSEHVKEAIQGIENNIKNKSFWRITENDLQDIRRQIAREATTVRDLESALRRGIGDPQKTMDAFRQAGIPGIRYMDQGSRGGGEGTHNYVVFDDKLIEITHKDGTPVSREELRAELQRAASGIANDREPLPEGAVERAGGYRIPITGNEGKQVGSIDIEMRDPTGRRKASQVRGAQIDADERGKGLGVDAYQKLADFALAQGKELWSDRTVEPEAQRIYEALKRRGYTVVEQDPNARPFDAQFKVTNGPSVAQPAEPDWKGLAAAARPPDQDIAEASKIAEKAPEVPSTDPAKSLSALEKAAAEAEQLWREIEPLLPPEQRGKFNELLGNIDLDAAEREQIIRDGAACLMAAGL